MKLNDICYKIEIKCFLNVVKWARILNYDYRDLGYHELFRLATMMATINDPKAIENHLKARNLK